MASPLAASSSDSEDFHSLNGRDDEPTSPQARSRAIAGSTITSNVSSTSQHQQIHDTTVNEDHVGSTESAANAPLEEDGEQEDELSPPEHPLKSMQGPFEESILESSLEQQRPASRQNAEARRQKLLDAQRFDESWTTRWKQRPEAQYHPLLKLMSQITFGMHLLQQNQAKSNEEVVKILQSHVDEVDNFLEQTAEDTDLAIRDIDERIRFLQLPMQHMKVFDIMLDDDQFRTQLLDGNDKIERIIDRTARAMNAALSDVQKGRQATRELSKYLNSVQNSWPFDKVELEAIFNAMRGNEEGWKKCYKTLQTKGNHLGNKLIELGTIIGEMSRMAAAASRRTSSSPGQTKTNRSSATSSTVLRSRFSVDAAIPSGAVPAKDKPLPRSPAMSSSKNRPVSYHQRFERPREPVPTPLKPVIEHERPRTSTGETTSHRADAFRNAGPLSSHPPAQRPRSAGNDRSNGSLSKTRPRTQDESTLKAGKAQSAESPTRTRDSTLLSRKDSMNGTSFMRRWSIKKRQPSIVSTESSTTAGAQDDRKTSTAPRSKSAPPGKESQRLDSVSEQPEPTPQLTEEKLTEAQEALKKAGVAPPEPEDLKFLAQEPKTLRGSFRLGRSNNRQSVISNAASDSTRAKSEAPSIASSIRRRSAGFRNFFQRKV